MVLRVWTRVYREQANLQHVPCACRTDVRQLRQRSRQLRAGDRQPDDQQRAGPRHVAGQPTQQAVRVRRQDLEKPRRRHERGRRSRYVVGGVDVAALFDEHDQVDLGRQQQAARRGRLLDEHRALREPRPAWHCAVLGHGSLAGWRTLPGLRAWDHEPCRVGCHGRRGISEISGSLQPAGIGFVRDRISQRQVRLPAFVGAGRQHPPAER